MQSNQDAHHNPFTFTQILSILQSSESLETSSKPPKLLTDQNLQNHSHRTLPKINMCHTVNFVYGCGHPHSSRRHACEAHWQAMDRGAAESWDPCAAGRRDPDETRNFGGRHSLCPRCRDRRERDRKDRDALRPISGNRNDSKEERAARRRYAPYYR